LFFLIEDRKISSENPGNGSAEGMVKLSTADSKEEPGKLGIVEKTESFRAEEEARNYGVRPGSR
jgi:hypothetical protein